MSRDIAGSFFQVLVEGAPSAGRLHGSGALEGDGAAARSEPWSSPVRPVLAYAVTPAASATARADARTTLRRLAFRWAVDRRCCWRSYFSLASCRRR